MQSIYKVISQMMRNNYPFFIFREPETTELKCGFQMDNSVTEGSLSDFIGKQGFLVAPFSQQEPKYLLQSTQLYSLPEDACQIERLTLKPLPWVEETEAPSPYISSPEEYMMQCNQFIEAIRAGKAQKAILSRIVQSKDCNRSHAADLFVSLTKLYPKAFVYLVHIPGRLTWLGATPEMLLCMDHGHFRTMALAGTMKWHSGITDQLGCWSEKDLHEQEFVTRYIRECLQNAGIEHFEQSPVQVYPAGNIGHLLTAFEGNLTYEQGYQLVETLHPTPAVCGTPKEAALELIHQYEKHNRSYYAGYVGYTDGKEYLHFYVNLRCAHLRKQDALLYVGGGITADSVPEKEWKETCLKSQTLLNVIQHQK